MPTRPGGPHHPPSGRRQPILALALRLIVLKDTILFEPARAFGLRHRDHVCRLYRAGENHIVRAMSDNSLRAGATS